MSQDFSYFVQSYILGKCDGFNKQSVPAIYATAATTDGQENNGLKFSASLADNQLQKWLYSFSVLSQFRAYCRDICRGVLI